MVRAKTCLRFYKKNSILCPFLLHNFYFLWFFTTSFPFFGTPKCFHRKNTPRFQPWNLIFVCSGMHLRITPSCCSVGAVLKEKVDYFLNVIDTESTWRSECYSLRWNLISCKINNRIITASKAILKRRKLLFRIQFPWQILGESRCLLNFLHPSKLVSYSKVQMSCLDFRQLLLSEKR